MRVASPSAGATVSGAISLAGSAGDNVAVTRVQVSVDGGAYAAATGTSSWNSALDTTNLANGGHSVTVRAYDASGNSALSSVAFTVSNVSAPSDATAPEISITDPTEGASVDRQVSVGGTAADDTGLATIEVKLDDGPFQPATGTTSWNATLDAATATDGQHVVTARASDTAGNVSSTSTVVLISDQAVSAPAASPGTVGGFVFQESDRDGVFETAEQPLGGLYVYLYDSSGAFVRNALTDAAGWYRFSGLPDGTYRVELAPISWNPLKRDWVADTTGTIFPRTLVSLTGSARADLGTRRIVRSTDAGAPISTTWARTGSLSRATTTPSRRRRSTTGW